MTPVDSNVEHTNKQFETPGHDSTREVTLLDLWLVVRTHRRFAWTVAILFILGSIALALLLPPTHKFTTAIEIGNYELSERIISIESPITVMAKLENGYIPLAVLQFTAQDPDGSQEYEVEVVGAGDSRLVTLISHAPRSEDDTYIALHSTIVKSLVEDHDRTVNSIRDKAELAVAEAEQKLGEMVAQQSAVAEQLQSISQTLDALNVEEDNLKSRIRDSETEVDALRRRPNCGDSCTNQIIVLSNQIGEWRSVLVEIEDSDKVSIYRVRADAQIKRDNNAQEQKTALNEIKYRRTNLDNIVATRPLGQGTIMSIKPVSPNKPVMVLVALVMGLVVAVAGALILEFLARAKKIQEASE